MIRMIGAVVVAALCSSLACNNKIERGRIHGVITVQGKPAHGCTVVFLAKDNMAYRAEIDKDGRYSVDGVARGPLKITVFQEPPRVAPRPEFAGPAGKGGGETKDSQLPVAPPPSVAKERAFTLSPQYNNADTSGLSLDLKSADQEWSIDLK